MTGELPQPYPLTWPAGRPRRPPREREADRYQVKTVRQAVESLDKEIKRWREPSRTARIVAHELTTDPAPRGREDPLDPAASLWFQLGGKDITAGRHGLMVLSCDKFRRLPQNIRAISLTMERLRLVDEVGAYTLVAAVEGARALPPPSSWQAAIADADAPWRQVLGVADNAPLAVAEAAYRALAKDAHPDKQRGNQDQMARLNMAIEQAREELRNG